MKKPTRAVPNLLLKHARQQRGWSQKDVADRMQKDGDNDCNEQTVGRWERGETFPQPHYRQKLCKLFEKSAEELGLIEDGTDESKPPAPGTPLPVPPTPSVPFWNVPYRRNLFFTGREHILTRLHDTLTSDRAAALMQTQAISGLGGIGKTQTAVEYAYRYQKDYQAILWARADSRELLVSDFVRIADLLKLPEKDEQDQSRVVKALKRWLESSDDWLLILDNVDDLSLASDFLPDRSRGHTLLTTREQVTGAIAQRIELETMEPQEGALFLLRRAQIIARDAPPDTVASTDWARAREIARAMDGLPLALDQAGAYIDETACGLSGYLERYRKRRGKLLSLRGKSASDHLDPIATTWSLSFEKVQKANPAAAELLRFCAFLHPDAIPEEIISHAASEFGPVLGFVADDLIELDAVIGELRRFSLLRRNPETQTITIHRLVQEVLKDGMDEQTQRQWGERAVRTVNHVFPEVKFEMWQACERYLPHAQVCAGFIEQWKMVFPEAAHLLRRVALYLQERVQYAEAEPLLHQSLAIFEKTVGSEHNDVAQTLDTLAVLYYCQGKYAEAEPVFQRALTIRKKVLEPDHPDVADSLNNLAMIYYEQGKYEQAEPLFQQALVIWETKLGPQHPYVHTCLSNLGLLYYAQGKYAQAEPLYQRALTLSEQILGSDHPEMAFKLNNLAMLYRAEGKYTEAEPFFLRALAIREKTLEPEHPDVATSLNNLAGLYRAQGRYEQAEPIFLRALAIRENTLGREHPDVATSVYNLALLYHAQGKYREARPLFQRALVIWKQKLGPEHPYVAQTLNNLGRLYHDQSKYIQAEPLYQQALAISEQTLGLDHPEVAAVLENYAELLRKTNREDEATKLEARASGIRMKHAQEQYA